MLIEPEYVTELRGPLSEFGSRILQGLDIVATKELIDRFKSLGEQTRTLLERSVTSACCDAGTILIVCLRSDGRDSCQATNRSLVRTTSSGSNATTSSTNVGPRLDIRSGKKPCQLKDPRREYGVSPSIASARSLARRLSYHFRYHRRAVTDRRALVRHPMEIRLPEYL